MRIDIVFKNGTKACYNVQSDKSSEDNAIWVLGMSDSTSFRIAGLVANRSEIAAIQFRDEPGESNDE